MIVWHYIVSCAEDEFGFKNDWNYSVEFVEGFLLFESGKTLILSSSTVTLFSKISSKVYIFTKISSKVYTFYEIFVKSLTVDELNIRPKVSLKAIEDV